MDTSFVFHDRKLCRLQDPHREKVQELCRVCGRVLVARGKRHRALYQCTVFSELDTSYDVIDIPSVVLPLVQVHNRWQCSTVCS